MRKHVLRWSIAAFISIVIIPLLVGVINTPTLEAQGPPNLGALHQRLLPLFELNGVVYTDADERTGRLVVGVVNAGLEASIRARLNGLGVSSQSVDVVVTEPIVQLTTLQDYIRPIEGGLQVRWDNYLCTLGFNGVRAGIAGFAVASHCTTKQGGVNGTKYYQPLNQTTAEFIGTEIADPSYRRNIPGCPPGRVCRYSDSAYAQRASGVNAAQGFIAMPDSVNTGSLTIVADQFRITSEGASLVGQIVNKVGRTTGWTQGAVTNTCVNTGVSGTNIVQLCQDFVSAVVGGGDSSSPVFAISSGNDVQLRGILWGGNTSGTLFVYSPIANIERSDELGPISTCAPGFNC
jgi:hypothetical protein